MKEKTSITLSRELLTELDRAAGKRQSRSAFIELVLRRFFEERRRAEVRDRDLHALNHAAAELNREAEDALEYQSAVD